jgi:hypothetical protein
MNEDGIIKVKCKYNSDLSKCGLLIDICGLKFKQMNDNYMCDNFEVGWTTWFLNRDVLIPLEKVEWIMREKL